MEIYNDDNKSCKFLPPSVLYLKYDNFVDKRFLFAGRFDIFDCFDMSGNTAKLISLQRESLCLHSTRK